MLRIGNFKFLLMVFLLVWQSTAPAQDKSGGGAYEEVLLVDKDADYLPSKIIIDKSIPAFGIFKRLGKKVQHFLSLASADISQCKKTEIKFVSILDFHLYLAASHAVHTVTTDSFGHSGKACEGTNTTEAGPATCAFSKETISSLKDITSKKLFRRYLSTVEGATYREANETEKYFDELFK